MNQTNPSLQKLFIVLFRYLPSETLKVYIDYQLLQFHNSGLSESSGARTKLMLLECDSFNINSCQNVKILHASGKQEIWYYLLVSCAALRCWHSWQVVTTWQYLWLTCICYCQSFNCVKQEMFLRYSYTMKCLSDKNLWHVASYMYELIWTNVTRWLCDKLTV